MFAALLAFFGFIGLIKCDLQYMKTFRVSWLVMSHVCAVISFCGWGILMMLNMKNHFFCHL